VTALAGLAVLPLEGGACSGLVGGGWAPGARMWPMVEGAH